MDFALDSFLIIIDFFNFENLNSKSDFIKARAETDSMALRKKFSNDEIYKKNLPSNSSSKSLYSIAEKIRYESLGCKMLKGIQKNLTENYNITQLVYICNFYSSTIIP